MSFRAMKIQQFPDVELPNVIVSASLPGAAPAQMETEVARRTASAEVGTLKMLDYTNIIANLDKLAERYRDQVVSN